jgi:hypothetical protein
VGSDDQDHRLKTMQAMNARLLAADELVEALESTRRGYTLTGESVSQQRDRALARYREASDE